MKNSRIFLAGKTILIGVSISVFATVLIVYMTGLESHRTLLDNSLISVTILATIFFSFVSIGLYKGLHIHDNLSHKLKMAWGKPRSSVLSEGSYIPETPVSIEVGEGITGILVSIALWIIMTILFVIFLVLLDFVLWISIIALMSLIYWIIMRALKFIFTKSVLCQNDLLKSVSYGIGYTFLYVGWIYGVIFLSTLI